MGLLSFLRTKQTLQPSVAATQLPPPTATLPERPQRAALVPADLRVGAASRLKLALLGTCVSESFSVTANDLGHTADHYLMQSLAGDFPPAADWGSYDTLVVQLTLRHILWQIPGGAPDLLHTKHVSDEDYANWLDVANAHVRVLVDRIGAAAGSTPVLFLSFVEPPAAHQGVLLNSRRKSLYHFVHAMNDELAGYLEGNAYCHFIEVNDLVRHHGDFQTTDAYKNNFSHAAVSGTAVPSLVHRIEDAMSILRSEAPIKLIVTDLDNTLWRGVVAEFDQLVPHEHFDGWPLGYVEALLEFKRRGGLLAISSKNDHAPTLERFKTIWGTRLGIEEFCSIKINWGPKSESIRQILAETNLLPGNVLFVDDNPREIEEVMQALPEIRTLTGDQTAWRNVILYSAQTQVARITDESAARTQMIQAKVQRDTLGAGMDREAYLQSLQIQAQFDEITDADHPRFARASELINKTNQFNTTGRRWTGADFDALFAAGGRLVAVSSSDKFGENGLIAVAVVRGKVIEQVVMSCRVFGMGLETALMCQLFAAAEPPALALFAETGKNKASASYFKDHGFVPEGSSWAVGAAPSWPDWVQLV